MRKRGQNEGSIYERKDGRWVGEMSLGYVAGKRKRKLFYGETRRAVQEKLTAALRSQQQGMSPTDDRRSVERFLRDWLKDCAGPSLRPRSFVSYKQIVEQHLIPGLGRIPLSKLTPQQVQQFMNAKLKELRSPPPQKRKKERPREESAEGDTKPEEELKPLAPRTVQYMHAILRSALGQALRWGFVARNVATLIVPPRVRHAEIRPLGPDQARTLLAAVVGNRLEALYSVALSVGLRQGEALGLSWDDLDLDARTLTVRHSLQRVEGKLVLVEPKTERSRRKIALPAVTIAALRAHSTKQKEERLLAGKRWKATGLVFTTSIGTPMDPRNVTRHFHAVLDAAGLPSQRFHDLRHACASLLLVQGVHPRVVMETLGHSQISLTMNTYSHVVPELQREAAGRMDALLTGGPG